MELEILPRKRLGKEPDVCKIAGVPASYSQSGRRRGSLEGSLAPLDEQLGLSYKGGAGEPATRSESDSEGGDKPQPESKGRSR